MWQETEAERGAVVVEHNDENVWLSLEKLVSVEAHFLGRLDEGSVVYILLRWALVHRDRERCRPGKGNSPTLDVYH